ncbi:hypothetical protein PV327_008757 [Microctonus hyperodae]|uniref:Uncharacterized protein n=1 Tax=Microctonus hyperodae TaxID=165561 RepID=A0AA39KVC5_MICHY|nr:hypothetical protein PV327_008757 [Microctonus hyperodae]
MDDSSGETKLTSTVFQEERCESNQPTTSNGISRPGPGIKRKSNDDISAQILSSVNEHFKQPQPQTDCCELLGRIVAVKMRSVKDKRLHIMYEKKIFDILCEAEMSALNYSNSTFTSPEYYTISTTPSPQHYTQAPTPSPQHYTPDPTPSPQYYTQAPTLSPQHYTQAPILSPQHYTQAPIPSPPHYTPAPTPSPQHHAPIMQQEQNQTSHNNTETAGSYLSTSNFE